MRYKTGATRKATVRTEPHQSLTVPKPLSHPQSCSLSLSGREGFPRLPLLACGDSQRSLEFLASISTLDRAVPSSDLRASNPHPFIPPILTSPYPAGAHGFRQVNSGPANAPGPWAGKRWADYHFATTAVTNPDVSGPCRPRKKRPLGRGGRL